MSTGRLECPHCEQTIHRRMTCAGRGHVMNLAHGAKLELGAGDLTPVVGGEEPSASQARKCGWRV
jgi:hypothetical protein